MQRFIFQSPLALPLTILLVVGCNKAEPVAHAQKPQVPMAVAMEPVEVAHIAKARSRGAVPAAVVAKIEAMEDTDLEEWEAEDFYIDDSVMIFNVPRMDASTLQMFISKLPRRPTCPDRFILYLHDPETDGITADPIEVSGQWLGEKGLFPRLTDLELDGQFEIAYRDFQHNGTVTNTEQVVCLRVGPGLSLTEVLRVDTTDSNIYSKSESGVIRKRLLREPGMASNRLLVECWEENPRFGSKCKRLESVQLQQDPATRAWHPLASPEESADR